ncbi:MAG: hypothetical protein ABWZ76_11215 [Acidimicrobiales bacterium]
MFHPADGTGVDGPTARVPEVAGRPPVAMSADIRLIELAEAFRDLPRASGSSSGPSLSVSAGGRW